MTISIDGKVTGPFLETQAALDASEYYYQIHRRSNAQAFACGRVTMESSFTKGNEPDYIKKGKAGHFEDYIGGKASFYAVSFDRKGRLGWSKNKIEDEDPGYNQAHIIEVLTGQADAGYLEYLRSKEISYIYAGENDLDLGMALEKLKDLFGIETLLLEGGSVINGAFEKEGLIDKLSLVVAPVLADDLGKDLFEDGSIQAYSLTDIEQLGRSCIWMQYERKKG